MARFLRVVWIAATLTVASAGVAFADTIDAGAQALIVGGGLILGALFIGLGLYLILRSLMRRRQAHASVNWPTAEGKILATSVRTERRSMNQGSFEVYMPVARYAYSVAGTAYEGSVIRPGTDQFGYSKTEEAQAQADKYPLGATVPVRYDPANPSAAVLETAEYGSGRNIFAGIISLAIGAVLFYVGVATSTMATH